MAPLADEDEIRHREPPREVWRRSRKKAKSPPLHEGREGRRECSRQTGRLVRLGRLLTLSEKPLDVRAGELAMRSLGAFPVLFFRFDRGGEPTEPPLRGGAHVTGDDDVQAGGSSAKPGFWPSSITSC